MHGVVWTSSPWYNIAKPLRNECRSGISTGYLLKFHSTVSYPWPSLLAELIGAKSTSFQLPLRRFADLRAQSRRMTNHGLLKVTCWLLDRQYHPLKSRADCFAWNVQSYKRATFRAEFRRHSAEDVCISRPKSLGSRFICAKCTEMNSHWTKWKKPDTRFCLWWTLERREEWIQFEKRMKRKLWSTSWLNLEFQEHSS